MVNQELVDYIKGQLQQNVSREQIKSTLTANGWLPSDVEGGFIAIGPQPSAGPATAPPFTAPSTHPVTDFANPVMPPGMQPAQSYIKPTMSPVGVQSTRGYVNPVSSQQIFAEQKKPRHLGKVLFWLFFVVVLAGLGWLAFRFLNISITLK